MSERLRNEFASEFRVDPAARRSFGARYRMERESLEAWVASIDALPPDLAGVGEAFSTRSRRVRPVARRLVALARRERLTVPLSELAGSLAHMSMNRLLVSHHRHQEAVLYDFMHRLHDTERARLSRATSLSEEA